MDALPEPKTLFVYRPVLNGDEILVWAAEAGLHPELPATDLHVTIAHSCKLVSWAAIPRVAPGELVAGFLGFREVKLLGPGPALVLKFYCDALWGRWREVLDRGASWDFPGYQPHITLGYDWQGELPSIPPFLGPIILGSERWEEVQGG